MRSRGINGTVMFKEAVRSLKKDGDRAACYWLVFFISSLFLFLFFHLALSDAVGVTYFYSQSNLATYLTTFDVAACIVVIFLANNFYVGKKSKELAMFLVSGGTYGQLVEFLIFQTGILMATAIPLGIGIGHGCYPAAQKLIEWMAGADVARMAGEAGADMARVAGEIGADMARSAGAIGAGVARTTVGAGAGTRGTGSSEAALLTEAVIFLEIFWCTMVNLGYCYRSSIRNLLQKQRRSRTRRPILLRGRRSRWLYLVLYLGCAFLPWAAGDNSRLALLLTLPGLVGLSGTVDRILLPYLRESVSGRWISDGEKLVYMGFFREDLKTARLYILLFISSAVLLMAAMASSGAPAAGAVLTGSEVPVAEAVLSGSRASAAGTVLAGSGVPAAEAVLTGSRASVAGLTLVGSGARSTEAALAFLSFVLVIPLLALSLMFAFSSEMAGRREHFAALEKLGFSKEQQRRITGRELQVLYGFILAATLFYLVNLAGSFCVHGQLAWEAAGSVLLVFVTVLVLCGGLHCRYYRKAVLPKED